MTDLHHSKSVMQENALDLSINQSSFMLGDILVSPQHNTLDLQDQKIKLQPKAMAVLHYLALHNQRVINNQELMENLWRGRIVTQGSVQKSINALRSAFAELKVEQEVIAYYSKRGYQLKLTPHFMQPVAAESGNTGTASSIYSSTGTAYSSTGTAPKKKSRHLYFSLIGVALLLAIAFAITAKKITFQKIVKNHQVQFSSTEGYTLETGHERNATPHPDNQHVAYVIEKLMGDGEMESEIVIRNAKGQDWHLSKSQGSWYRLAWSPSGKQLAAIEVKSQDGSPRRPNFYDKANYLYSFHIFTLDLANDRLLEKQILSQWHGRIFSVTWWDENTIEVVAKQGANGNNTRYRYSTLNQELSSLDELEGAGIPVASVVLNKKTALASLRQNAIQIDFLDEQQHSLSHWKIDANAIDLSWIPDASGVLIFSDEEQKLFELDVNGEQLAIPVTAAKDKIISRPKYQFDGKAIYYTEEQRTSNIISVDLNEVKIPLTQNTNLNYNAIYSQAGDKVVYASVRNNQTHLWLVENNQERQLTLDAISKKVTSIIWSDDDKNIIFGAGNSIYAFGFDRGKTSLLYQDKIKMEPLVYLAKQSALYLIKNEGDVRNLWRIDLKTQQQKQLTFGSVGSALALTGDIYFQYVGEEGLWVLRNQQAALEQVSTKLPASSKLLKLDNQGIYFVTGGSCNESDIQYFSFAQSQISTTLNRHTKLVSTTSFNPKRGVLETECYLPEANIMRMK